MVLWSAQSPAQTVYSVTTTADSGAGSLRQAVDDLNASGAAGVISFVSGSSGTIDLASGLTLTQEASLLNNSGGAVAVSLSGASDVTALSAASLGTIGGASALAIEAEATSGSNAYGIFSGGALAIGSMASTGSITATAATGNASGIRASGDVTIAGVMAGTITATAGGHTALGIWSGGTLTVGSASAPLSGTVSARANGLAVAVASDGAMNLYVTGTLSGTDTSGSGNGYAIRAGSPDGSGGWTTGSADNTVTLGTGATLVGKVDLGTGTNTLALVGTGSADNLFAGVDTLVAGDGATATSWTLTPAAADASTYGAATVNPLASLTVNENVTVTGDIANGGTLVFDIGAGKTYGGIISDTGGATKTGDAALVLSGATTYTGTTLAAWGQLRLTRTLNSR
ncbi:MAG: hypothetical protein GYA47_11105, partial [Desulfovibrio sp.]|nr:hypothetical protein [Desulfovibrio sp.]